MSHECKYQHYEYWNAQNKHVYGQWKIYSRGNDNAWNEYVPAGENCGVTMESENTWWMRTVTNKPLSE